MKWSNRNSFVIAGLFLAVIAWSLAPSKGETQESPEATPTRGRAEPQVSPPTRPTPPSPATSATPATPPSASNEAPAIKSLIDQIRKEVMESLHSELQIKARVAPSGNIREPKAVVEERVEKLVGELTKVRADAAQKRVAAELDRLRESARLNVSPDAKSVKVRVQAVGERDGGIAIFKSSGADQQFELRTRELLATYDQYDESKKEKFVELLTKLVAEHFEYKQSIRESELKQLEAQLKKLQSLHDQRTTVKNEIIQDRVRQLTREAAGLGWGSEKSGDDAATESREAIIIEHRDDTMPQGKRTSKPRLDYCYIHGLLKPPASWSFNFSVFLNNAESSHRPLL